MTREEVGTKVENRAHFYWDTIIELETRKGNIEPKLPNVTEEEFNEYCLIVELLAPLYDKVPSL